jgi:hypothetical protein
MRSSSPAIFLMTVRICAFFGGMSFLHAFFSSNIDIRNVRLSSSNLKAFRSRPSREQLLTNLEPLFNKEFTVYQNTVESLRRTWKRIHEFDSSDGSDDSFTGIFSADGFQDEKEYSVVKELEVQ